MTEKEIFLNMIHRVIDGVMENEKNFYREEDDNTIVVINSYGEETNFQFDEEGFLVDYD